MVISAQILSAGNILGEVGGVDFRLFGSGDKAQVSEYVPDFRDIDEANRWARDKKYNIDLVRLISNKIGNLYITLGQNRDNRDEFYKRTEDQYKYCLLALSIMEDYNDAAMTSEEYFKGYEIPTFQNRPEAIIWVYKMKYIEPVRRLLVKRQVELMAKAQETAGKVDGDSLKKTSYYMEQWEDCNVALHIMEKLRDLGIHGDAAMTFEVPRARSENYYIAWAKAVKGSPTARKNVIKRMVFLQRIAREKEGGKRKDDVIYHDGLMKEWEILGKVLQIIDGDMPVGSVVHSYSVWLMSPSEKCFPRR